MTDWKRKLAAYLHDPPSKCCDLRTHQERSDRALSAAGFSVEERHAFAKQADLTASSADRFPFPGSRSAGLTCVFDGVRAGFHHPLGGSDANATPVLSFGQDREVSGAEVIEGQLEEREQTVQPVLTAESLARLPDDAGRWRARFFAHWRLWPQHAAERDGRFAFLPADTRLPDHTIWTHNAVVSALAGCAELDDASPVTSPEQWVARLRSATLKPAFLKFQLGPVQDFIAQARSTRDLWSGSYLLSWLIAAGLKALSAEVGPDAVIFPNLRGQALFDLHWRDELWNEVHIGSRSVWESLYGQDGGLEILTPNLPNVFLAIVPAAGANELGELVAGAVRKEWEAIRDSVWSKVSGSGLLALCPSDLGDPDNARSRFVAQTERFLNISWLALGWPATLDEAKQLASILPRETPVPGEPSLVDRFEGVVHAATVAMPKDHRDGRYYIGWESGPKENLSNIGLGWALLTARTGWSLDAVRQTRAFPAWSSGGWQHTGVAQSKDALTGREEMVFGGSGFIERLAVLTNVKDKEEWQKLFKHNDEVGAVTLVKRVWHWSYLAEKWKLKARRGQYQMPNTRTIADHRPFEDDSEDNVEQVSDHAKDGKYFAVLALDGDQIGKWVSGDKSPRYRTQFADYKDSSGAQHFGSLEYFERDSDPDGQGGLKDRFARLLDTRRLVSPSYHLQLSEALSNFSLRCARPIVEAFDGRLIYAGGDDVRAMLPADIAVECARALRMAFRGEVGLKGFLQMHAGRLRRQHEARQKAGVSRQGASDYQQLAAEGTLLDSTTPGFSGRLDLSDQQGLPIPFLVPGPAADCSVGIAIAHFKSPLQDVVREAQAAEKRAKKELGRSALAVTLMKRSGETIHWGCQWDSGGLEAYEKMHSALSNDVVSSKFPHRIVELTRGYLTEELGKMGRISPAAGFNDVADDVLRREIGTAADRQRGKRYSPAGVADTLDALLAYVGRLSDANSEVQALIGLCQTVAFVERNLPEDDSTDRSAKSENATTAERQPVTV